MSEATEAIEAVQTGAGYASPLTGARKNHADAVDMPGSGRSAWQAAAV